MKTFIVTGYDQNGDAILVTSDKKLRGADRQLIASTRLLALDGTVVLTAVPQPRASLVAWGNRAVEFWLKNIEDDFKEFSKKRKQMYRQIKKAQTVEVRALNVA